jgi:hypothetical protein
MQQICSAIFDFITTSRTMIFVRNLYDVESNGSEVHAHCAAVATVEAWSCCVLQGSYKNHRIYSSVVSILPATLDSICAARHPCLLIFGQVVNRKNMSPTELTCLARTSRSICDFGCTYFASCVTQVVWPINRVYKLCDLSAHTK